MSTLQEWITSLRFQGWWDFLTLWDLGSPLVFSDWVETFLIKSALIHWIFSARHSIEGFTRRISTLETVQTLTTTFWGRNDFYPIVQSRKPRLEDGGSCPAREWAELAGKPSSDGLQSVKWEARCFLLVLLLGGLPELGRGHSGRPPHLQDQVPFLKAPPTSCSKRPGRSFCLFRPCSQCDLARTCYI